MTKDERNVVLAAEVGEPVPAKDALDADEHITEVLKDQFEKQFRIGFDVLMHFDLAFAADNADVHFACVQVDTAIVLVLLGVESHGLAYFG
jgi:hypothetical protein